MNIGKQIRKLIIIFSICILSIISLSAFAQDNNIPVVQGTPPPAFTPTNDPGEITSVPDGQPWLTLPQLDFIIPPYASYLRGKKICLDPGHGGYPATTNYKMGPTGLQEEAVDLKVAQMLRDWLLQCGVTVYMTRDGAYNIAANDAQSLALRSDVANLNNVDFFISLHHNASPKAEVNFPSFWYHDNPDYMYSSLDLGRYICQELLDNNRHRDAQNAGGYSDFLIYPGDGFGVLRHLQVPGILVESSFHSNPDEEGRLKKDEYLKREAWSYFMGLCKYARAGFPTYEVVAPVGGKMKSTDTIQIKLIDNTNVPWGSKGAPRIYKDTIKLDINGYDVPYTYNSETGILSYTPPSPMKKGAYKIIVKFMNANKNSALPKFTTIIVE